MKTIKSTTLILIISMVLYGCTPTPVPAVKEYNYQGNTHQITSAHTGELGGKKFIFFLSDGLLPNSTNTDLIGQGDMLIFFIPITTSIAGTYNFKTQPKPYSDSGVNIGISSFGDQTGTHFAFNTGTINITPYSGGGYSIVINGDPDISFTYEGVLDTFTY